MKITYDREVDALYIRFKETTVTTKHLEEGISADYDAFGYSKSFMAGAPGGRR
ncbi:MAG: DUF2283 domain-containing protein [Proteobacteria bacterium]|nr:DUF2283 domain-containing protein [Pseudomonadota bacterium]